MYKTPSTSTLCNQLGWKTDLNSNTRLIGDQSAESTAIKITQKVNNSGGKSASQRNLTARQNYCKETGVSIVHKALSIKWQVRE